MIYIIAVLTSAGCGSMYSCYRPVEHGIEYPNKLYCDIDRVLQYGRKEKYRCVVK